MAVNYVWLMNRRLKMSFDRMARLGLAKKAFFITLNIITLILSGLDNHGKVLSNKLWD